MAAVLSGNRNFEGRINPQVKANYLASPPLVVAYALAGRVDIDMSSEPLGTGSDGAPVYLKDIWPTPQEVDEAIRSTINAEMFRVAIRDRRFEGDANWQTPAGSGRQTFIAWDENSTYIKKPPYFDNMVDPNAADRGSDRAAHAGAAGRFDHDRPHLAGGLDCGEQSGRASI